MQVKIGSGGGTPVRMQFGGGGVRSVVRSAAETLSIPESWIYMIGIVVLLAIVAGLIVLIVREYNAQKNKKK